MSTSSNSEPQPQPESLPMFHLSSEMFPTEHRFEAWRQFTAPAMSAELSEPKSDDYSFNYTGYLSDKLVFGRATFDKIWFSGSSAESTTEVSEQIILQFYISGQAQGSLENGTPLLLQPDRIVLHDMAYGYTGVATNCDVMSITIPRHLLTHHDLIYSHTPVLPWSITSPSGRLLKTAIEMLWEELPSLTPIDAASVDAGLLGLINGLLSGQLDEATRPAVEQLTLQTMQKYIQANLHRADLKVEDLCQTYYCSRATVYRLFTPCGGLMNYIRQQRLSRCFQILKNLDPASRLSVKEIAARWGFTNPTHFSRLFKRQFDITPGELKSLFFLQTESDLHPGPEHDLEWLRRSLQ
ncbi:MAG: helix-turn-helix transcriptional regulator [Spirulinaceae cyanobacterium]